MARTSVESNCVFVMLCFFILCLSIVNAGSIYNSPKTASACEGQQLQLDCPTGMTLSILRVFYGREDATRCTTDGFNTNWSLNCQSMRALGIVQSMCQGVLEICRVLVSNRIFGDPCYLTPKYLEVRWKCVAASSAWRSKRSIIGDLTNSGKENTREDRFTPQRGRYIIFGSLKFWIIGNLIIAEGAGRMKQLNSDEITSVSDVIHFISDLNTNKTLTDTDIQSLAMKLMDIMNISEDTTQTLTTPIPGPTTESEQTEVPSPKPTQRSRPSIRPTRKGGYVHIHYHTQSNGKTISTNPPSITYPLTDDYDLNATSPEDDRLTTSTSSLAINETEIETTTPSLVTTAIPWYQRTTESTTTTKPSTTTTEAPVVTYASDSYCLPTLARNISWPATKAGEIAYASCPNNPEMKVAVWRCGLYPVVWKGRPDVSLCVSAKIGALQQKMQRARRQYSQEIMEEVADDVLAVSQEETFGRDILELTEVMNSMVETVDKNIEADTSKDVALVKKVNEAVMKAGSNVLGDQQAVSWHDLPQSDQAHTATRLVSTCEHSAYQVAKTLTKPETIIKPQINIVLEINVINTKGSHTPPNLNFPHPELVAASTGGQQSWVGTGNNFKMTGKTIKELGVDGLARVIFLTYNNLEQWLQPQADAPIQEDDSAIVLGQYDEDDNTVEGNRIYEPEEKNATRMHVGSKIISASVNGRTGRQELAEPITYTLEHSSPNNIYSPSCAFWEYSERTLDGKWSTQDCKVVDTNTTHTVCQCTHLTNFAILMDVHGVELSTANRFGLSFLTYFGCIISVVCLLICFLTFLLFKNLQCDRNTIHKNLVLCLLLAQLIFLAGIFHYDKPILCAIVAGMLHYFFLASFAWMCVEGIQIYVMLIEVFESEKSRVKYYYLGAYGLPALVVGISAAVDHQGYGTDRHCWLNTETGFIWAFVGPVIAVITVNCVMLSVAIYMMCKHANATAAWKMKQETKKTKLENIRHNPYDLDSINNPIYDDTISWLKGAVVLVVLLGLTWSFGLLYISSETAVMAYIFTILNTLQGLFIFIFHCVMNEKVQKEYKRQIRHATWLPENFRIKYGGARPYSSTPNQSTSSGNYLSRLLSKRRKRSSTTSLPKSTSSGKPPHWPYVEGKHNPQRDSAESGICSQQDDASGIYSEPTEDPNGYLEPVQLRMTDGLEGDIYHEISMMEGSIVDTDYMLGSVPPAVAALDIDKYKIKREPEEKPLLSQVERDLIGKATLCQAESYDSLHKSPLSSMNDLDKSIDDNTRALSNTNINIKGHEEEKCKSKDLDFHNERRLSDDMAVEKLKKALSSSNEGLISLYQGRTAENRLSEDTEDRLKRHNYRLTSSDC